MLRLLYNRNHTFNKLFWFFWIYFQDASIPTAENLFLLVISMLALDSFHSIRFAWRHIISRLTNKSLNSFYYTLGRSSFDHLRWMAVTGLVEEFENLEMICCARSDTVLYDLPCERTGRRGRPRVHGERLELSSIVMDTEGAPYHMGCRKVITNLWKGRTVYACVTAADPEKPSSFRLFLCTQAPEGIAIQPEKQADEKIRRYDTWGMLPLGLFSLRWNIETSYYETKTFWSFSDYMVRSVKGIESLTNLTCISYAAVRLLPYYSMEFQEYQGQSPQEIRYQLGEKIRMNIIIHSLGQTIETIKKGLPLKKAFQELMRKCGYL